MGVFSLTNQVKIYARLQGGVYFEYIAPMYYTAEAEGWAEGDPSRVGEYIPIEERYTPEDILMMREITDLDPMPQPHWTYDEITGAFSPPVAESNDDELAFAIRQTRDMLLRTVYDPGISMALRALRMSATPEITEYAEGKIVELDTYAENLLSVPDQVGFPQSVIWPDQPTK